MTAAQLHLLVVHLPVVGCLFTLATLAVGYRLGSEPILRLGYSSLIACALLSVAAYYSGPPAYEMLESALAPEKELVEQHALLGRAAFVGMVVAGAVALQAWLQVLQGERPGRWLHRALLVLTALLCYVLAWTAHLGGSIRHPEARVLTLPLFPALPESGAELDGGVDLTLPKGDR